MKKKQERKLQKAVNHTNKQIMRLEQLGLSTTDSQIIKAQLLMIGQEQGVKLNPGGMPR